MALQVPVGSLPNLGQRFGEREHAIVFDGIADLPPPRVIAILLPPARVSTGRLQVATRVGADPNVGPGGRDGQALDPPKGLWVTDGVAVAARVAEPLPRSGTPDPRREIGDVSEPGRPGRLDRVNQFSG